MHKCWAFETQRKIKIKINLLLIKLTTIFTGHCQQS